MKAKTTITVKEWFFNKVYDEMRTYHIFPAGTYTDGVLDRTKLRIEEVEKETEKAFKVVIDAETENGHVKAWSAWIPKSVIE